MDNNITNYQQTAVTMYQRNWKNGRFVGLHYTTSGATYSQWRTLNRSIRQHVVHRSDSRPETRGYQPVHHRYIGRKCWSLNAPLSIWSSPGGTRRKREKYHTRSFRLTGCHDDDQTSVCDSIQNPYSSRDSLITHNGDRELCATALGVVLKWRYSAENITSDKLDSWRIELDRSARWWIRPETEISGHNARIENRPTVDDVGILAFPRGSYTWADLLRRPRRCRLLTSCLPEYISVA